MFMRVCRNDDLCYMICSFVDGIAGTSLPAILLKQSLGKQVFFFFAPIPQLIDASFPFC